MPKSTQRKRGRTWIRRRSPGLKGQCSMEHLKITSPPQKTRYLLLSGFLQILCFPGSSVTSLIGGLQPFTKHEPKPSKTTVQERWTKEQEGDGVRSVWRAPAAYNLRVLVLESDQTLETAGWIHENGLCGW